MHIEVVDGKAFKKEEMSMSIVRGSAASKKEELVRVLEEYNDYAKALAALGEKTQVATLSFK